MTENKQSKLTKKQKEDQARLRSFLEEIDVVQKKHGLRFVAVMEYTKTGTYPRFEVQLAPVDEKKVDTAQG